MPYGSEWRQQRKIFQAILNITAVGSLQSLQTAEASLTLQQLVQSPQLYYDHIRRYSTAVILSSVFGIRGPEFNHPNIQRLYHVQDQFTAILETGATPPVDIFPFLKYLPTFLAPWRRWALKIRQEQRELYFGLLQSVKDRRAKGITRNCFMDQMLDDNFREKYRLNDEHIAYIGGVMMEGGSDTTASTLLSFLLAMTKYPHVLRKAQDAVDAVCGTQRSPTFEDLKNMPYIKHCILEVSPLPVV
jgi:cytochrome P450